ncbi:FAD-binding oxidoreductase, partial [Bacteroides xylanisolvens]
KEYSYSYKIVLNKLLNHISDVKNVDTFSGTKVISITDKNERYQIEIENGEYIECKGVVNATYASTNIVSQLFNKPGFNLKYELCEVILCKVPDTLKDIGITVMDGEFFSIMPFGFSKYHTLTSVHYTPHTVSSPEPSFPCMKNGSCSPHNIGNCNLCLHKPLTAYEAMKTQYEEFIHPQLHGIEYISSMFAIKPIQISSEKTDERNTLIQMAKQPPFYISVLSGKISTFYELDSYLIELINLLKGS